MIRRVVLHALGRGIEAGAREAAFAALRPFDPLLRGAARRRLLQLFIDAQRRTAVGQPAHVMRVAAFVAAGREPVAEYDDIAGIEQEAHALLSAARKPPRGGPWLSLALAALTALVPAASAALFWLLQPFDPRATAAGRVLGAAVPDFIVAVSRGAEVDIARAKAAATAPEAREALGGAAADRLSSLLDAALALAGAKADSLEAPHERFIGAAGELNAALAGSRLPYFVDTDTLVHQGGALTPLLLSFYIEREVEVAAGDRAVRVLHLWRLDRINMHQGYLGYTRPSMAAAVVLLDQLEADLVRYVLPSLPPGEPALLVDEETAAEGPAWAVELGTRAGEALRRHHAAIPAERRGAVLRVGELLAERRRLIQRWRVDLAMQGRRLMEPERWIPEFDYRRDLELRVPREQLRRWDALHGELQEREHLEAFLWLRDRYVASVQRHEVQHRLDYEAGLMPVPPLLAERLGVDNPLAVSSQTLAGRARDELSAYLASIVQAKESPLLEVVLLSRFLFNRHQGADAYAYAALAALEGIGGELGLDVEGIVGRGVRRPPALARLLLAILSQPEDRIAPAASRFYEASFGRPVPEVLVRRAELHEMWRH